MEPVAARRSESQTLEGRGLHTGRPARLTLRRTERAEVELVAFGRVVALRDLVVVSGDRSTVVASRDGTVRVATVEHVLAAVGGLGIRAGLAIDVEGDEVPLLDGGARGFAAALAALGLPSAPAALVVARAGAIEVGASRYTFVPDDGTRLEAQLELELPNLLRSASWSGDPDDFLARIAPARTFGFEHEVLALVERGLASHVAPESVVVLGPERVLAAGEPFTPDEPARHKLLDLVGDLTLHGGPPRGLVQAFRPGHAATHEAVRRALDVGILAR